MTELKTGLDDCTCSSPLKLLLPSQVVIFSTKLQSMLSAGRILIGAPFTAVQKILHGGFQRLKICLLVVCILGAKNSVHAHSDPAR